MCWLVQLEAEDNDSVQLFEALSSCASDLQLIRMVRGLGGPFAFAYLKVGFFLLPACFILCILLDRSFPTNSNLT